MDLLSSVGQATMRRLDIVTVKGSEVPTGIYTYDALQEQVFVEDKQQGRPVSSFFDCGCVFVLLLWDVVRLGLWSFL